MLFISSRMGLFKLLHLSPTRPHTAQNITTKLEPSKLDCHVMSNTILHHIHIIIDWCNPLSHHSQRCSEIYHAVVLVNISSRQDLDWFTLQIKTRPNKNSRGPSYNDMTYLLHYATA
ncbi:hypothetical protein QVD99_007707 [Batrachochytrium dendrobatidis]|nr:hypothetical protein QVD99_007707 [Batrachochytrium dendrobatidis]